ncbi:hypothetical protein EVAR_35700_1 [Eumeta japonica]|uniref:Uncharacterized protein n=1 Tax=Eumeta variegata TaxID=151549 RepID=A0A4C1VG45_EUMVA|nr:hypothetical protein EVAR_35700_1 [Eumeta japonica]
MPEKSFSSRRAKEKISAMNFDVSKLMPKKSKLRNMYVELNKDDVMRAIGHLDRHQSLDAESKRPVILHWKNRITELLAQNAHQKCMHGNHTNGLRRNRKNCPQSG